MGRNSKRKKRDDSSSESSPSNSISSMIQTQIENKQLDEITSKLSLILKAIQDLSISVKKNKSRKFADKNRGSHNRTAECV